MKSFKKILVVFLAAMALLLLITACAVQNDDAGNKDDTKSPFPDDGILKLLENGKAPMTMGGCNPSLLSDNVVVFFDFAFDGIGLDLDENTEIKYRAKKIGESRVEGTAKLDTTVSKIKNEHGYIGLSFDMGMKFELFDQATVEISFKDKNGKEFSVPNMVVAKDLYNVGFTQEKFDQHLGEFVTTTIGKNSIKQVGEVNGVEFSLNIDLSGWLQKTKVSQIVICSRLFWECYPRMYARFGEAGSSATNITLAIENTGYEIASATPTRVHLHDTWLEKNPTDYDCLTHEFGHVVQNAWKRGYLEYDNDIELFAEYCRYIYAFDNGKYNDDHWSLAKSTNEVDREKSKRFLVWLDYTYSTEDNDIILKYFKACKSKNYPTGTWNEAWKTILAGTELEGKSIQEIFAIYKASEFSTLSTKISSGKVPLLEKYNVREKVKMFE